MSILIDASKINSDFAKEIRSKLSIRKKDIFGYPPTDDFLFWKKTQNNISLPFYFAKSRNFETKSGEPISGTFKGSLLRTEYKNQILDADESLKILEKEGSIILALHTGYGKTIMAAYLSCRLGRKVLVLHNRNNLETQWFKTFNEQTTLKIGIIGSSKENELNEAEIIICCVQSFHKIQEEILKGIGTLVIDEAHMFCTKTGIDTFLKIQIKYIIALTATPDRADGLSEILTSMCGPNIIIRKSQKNILVYKLYTGIKAFIHKNKRGDMDWSKLTKTLAESEERNEIALSLVKGDIDVGIDLKNMRILILTWSKVHAHYFLEKLKDEKVEIMAGNKNNYTNCRVLVGTISKIGVGFDEQNVCIDFDGNPLDVVFLLGSTKDENLLQQMVGRIRQQKVIVFDFVDDIAVIKKHSKLRDKWFEKVGASFTNIKFD